MEEQVIARLKASNKKYCAELFDQGRADGTAWAKESAEAIELRRLARAWDDRGNSDGIWDWLTYHDAYTEADHFVWHIRLGDKSEVGEAFFESEIFGDNEAEFSLAIEAEYIHGFASGALNVWNEVADKL